MSKRVINFSNLAIDPDNPVIMLKESGIFSFPSNIINSSLTISECDYGAYAAKYLSYLGAGVDHISFDGNQVSFSAWMKYTSVNKTTDNKDKIMSFLSPLTSYMVVNVVANCE
jgi:hypothetical protein